MHQDFVKRFYSSERNISEKTRMLAVLAEPARTIVLLASWTGLRQGEICGVRWKDFDGKTLKISRSIWKKNVINPPKTASSAAPIHVVKELREALEAHREREEKRPGVLVTPESPILQSTALEDGIGTPANLSNIAKRVIRPAIEKCAKCHKPEAEHPEEGHLFELDATLCWHGWHAFRRGLGTNLHALKIADREIQAILRHSNIAVTQKSYIKSLDQTQVAALDLAAEKMESGLIQ